MRCNRCGYEIPEGMRFCTNCGEMAEPIEKKIITNSGNEHRVVFKRKLQYCSAACALVVKIDGVERMRLAVGQEKEVFLSEGEHLIELAMRFTLSKILTLNVDGERRIKCYYPFEKAMMPDRSAGSPLVAEVEVINAL